MSRPSPGELPPNAALSPFQTPPSGMPLPTTMSPYGPAGWSGGPAPSGPRNAPTVGGLLNALKRRWVLATFVVVGLVPDSRGVASRTGERRGPGTAIAADQRGEKAVEPGPLQRRERRIFRQDRGNKAHGVVSAGAAKRAASFSTTLKSHVPLSG